MFASFWFEFLALLVSAILGSIAILPYSLRLLIESKRAKTLKMPFWMLFLLSLLQNTVLFAIAIAIGLITAHQIGLGTPLVTAVYAGNGLNLTTASLLAPAFILGLLGGCFLFFADLLFLPYFPEKLLNTTLKTTQWENFTASFYGGINEELFIRLFGVSVISWLLSRIWHTPTGLPITIVFWTAIIIMAVIFALGHLPTLKSTVGKITTAMLTRAIVLNTPIGILCGWIFWHYGIEAAILTHFITDIVYHVGGTYILRSKFKHR